MSSFTSAEAEILCYCVYLSPIYEEDVSSRLYEVTVNRSFTLSWIYNVIRPIWLLTSANLCTTRSAISARSCFTPIGFEYTKTPHPLFLGGWSVGWSLGLPLGSPN